MECPVCFEDYSVAYAMSCGHLCCTACVGSLNGSCHTCRSVFHYENLKKIFFPSPTTIAEGVRKRLHNQEERNKVLVKQVECMTSQREKTHDTLEKIKNDANNLKNERHQFEDALKVTEGALAREIEKHKGTKQELEKVKKDNDTVRARYWHDRECVDAIAMLVKNSNRFIVADADDRLTAGRELMKNVKRIEGILREYMKPLEEENARIQNRAEQENATSDTKKGVEDKEKDVTRLSKLPTAGKDKASGSKYIPRAPSPHSSVAFGSTIHPTKTKSVPPKPKRKLSDAANRVANTIRKVVNSGTFDAKVNKDVPRPVGNVQVQVARLSKIQDKAISSTTAARGSRTTWSVPNRT